MRQLILVMLLASEFLIGADVPYQMDHYTVGFFRKGPNWGTGSKEEAERVNAGHMANIRKMGATGKLVVAGPFEDNGDLRGMLIFKTGLDEAKSLAEQDPAVKGGRLVLE